jgi:ribosomal protein S18 acetylase RimI-like enzyme
MLWQFHHNYGMTDVATTSSGGNDAIQNNSVDGVETAQNEVTCVALWEPPAMTAAAAVRALVFVVWLLWHRGFAFAIRLGRLFVKLEKKKTQYAPNAHHLSVLGTAIAAQGRGVGSALLQKGLARADALGVPCYLESSNPRNVTFYERHDFVTVELFYPFEDDGRFDDKGPLMTLMTRKVGGKSE